MFFLLVCSVLVPLKFAACGSVIFRDDLPHNVPTYAQVHTAVPLVNQAALGEAEFNRQSRASLQFPEKNSRLSQHQNAPILNTPVINSLPVPNPVEENEPSETELALLQAMENLVSRLQGIEQRISGLENIVAELRLAQQSVANGISVPNASPNSCPGQFSILPGAPRNSPCYYFSSNNNKRQNWKEAASSCQELGGKLVEPKNNAELIQLISHIAALKNTVGSNYWTGGINPGLLWIWSVGTKPLQSIGPDLWISSSSSTPGPEDNGKCLRLAYDQKTSRYGLQGADCDRYLYFICQYDENGASRKVTLPNGKSSSNLELSHEEFIYSGIVDNHYTTSSISEAGIVQPTSVAGDTISEASGHRNFVAVLGFRSVENSTEMVADVLHPNVDQFGPFVPSETLELESRTNMEQAP